MRTQNTNGNVFSLDLRYNQPDAGISAQYNGNISQLNYLTTKVSAPGNRSFSYTYDALNRLTNAGFTGGTSGDALNEQVNYDMMGNITRLVRSGTGGGTLNYTSYTGNQLNTVTGYSPRSYQYDPNGNATSDGQGQQIDYNLLNLPQDTRRNNTIVATYTYDATGQKLRNTGSDGSWDYIGGIIYHNNAIAFINTAEGRIANNNGMYNYEYNLQDHLGNNRVSFDIYNGAPRVIQEDEYYSFGLRKPTGGFDLSNNNRYLYNGKEIQTDLANQYDYGARFYDPVIARWTSVGPLADIYQHWSPYNYGANNPINNIDPNGTYVDNNRNPVLATRYVDPNGNTIINTDDGRDDVFVVPWNRIKEFKENIYWTDKGRGTSGTDAVGWNNYWRGEFQEVINESTLKKAGYYGLSSEESRAASVKYLITGNTSDFVALVNAERSSQWSDPVVATSALLAFAHAGVSAIPMSVEEVLENPNVLRGKSPANVEKQIGNTNNWKIEKLGKGSKKGQGWVLREYNGRGQPTGKVIRWHPGGGHHGPEPYWKVSNGSTTSGEIR